MIVDMAEPVPVKGRLRDAVIDARGAPMEAKALLHVLIHHADTVTLTCWPSVPTIAREVGCNEDTARKWLGILAAANIIRRFTRTKDSGANDSPGWVIAEEHLKARLESIPRSARGSIRPPPKDRTPSETSDGPGTKDPTAPVGNIGPPPSERSDTNTVRESGQGIRSRNTVTAPASGTLFVFTNPESPAPGPTPALPAPPKRAPDYEALWSALTAWTPKPGAWKLTADRRKHLAARIADHGEAVVYRVAEWVRTSNHDRAAFLRGHGDVDTLLRPSKFATYAAFSDGPAQQPTRNGRPVAPSYADTLREIEEMERAATTRGGAIDAAYEVLQ